MAEYIEREALIQHMQECKGDSAFNIMATGYAYAFIKKAPAADVVEVSELTPCDVCAFNPPSCMDGKPCTLCPAQAKMDGERGKEK